MISTLLIANRGEIACRIMRTAKKLGIRTVAVYSDADRHAMHVAMADVAVHIGDSEPQQSYLDIAKIIAAAKATGAQAIHPGYGFLSENAQFARTCADNHIIFVGPTAAAIDAMGSKSRAKAIMEAAKVPLLPGYHGSDDSADALRDAAASIGYPVLLKASAGGGGKGMRVVRSADQFDDELAAAQREARASFGDDAMLVEKYLTDPRHIEVQVFADTHGNIVHLFDRDCSIQRRHQKIIEEAPAPGIEDSVREAMANAAIQAAAAIDYVGAGTIEFLLDVDAQFYFMEMNTRLQVEHPVTEMITGVDLVEWQLAVASGAALPMTQDQLQCHGHAIEARIYAEDTDNGFLPQTGRIDHFLTPPEHDSVRIDTGVRSGDSVSRYYDPMIAKLAAHASTRERAVNRVQSALQMTHIVGLTNNVGFLQRAVGNASFAAGGVTTRFIEREHESLTRAAPDYSAVLAATVLWHELSQHASSAWLRADSWRMNQTGRVVFGIDIAGTITSVALECGRDDTELVAAHVAGERYPISTRFESSAMDARIGHDNIRAHFVCDGSTGLLALRGERIVFRRAAADTGDAADHTGDGRILAPMTGTIVSVAISNGDTIATGDVVVIMEAMKMEHTLSATSQGIVHGLTIKAGDRVDGGAVLLNIENDKDTTE